MLHWGRVTVVAAGLALLTMSAFVLVRASEAGVWALAGLAVATFAVVALPLASSGGTARAPDRPP